MLRFNNNNNNNLIIQRKIIQIAMIVFSTMIYNNNMRNKNNKNLGIYNKIRSQKKLKQIKVPKKILNYYMNMLKKYYKVFKIFN